MGMDLITSESSVLLNQIRDAFDIEQVKKMIKQLDAIKIALEAIDRFHEKSVIYAQLEAEAFVRLIELGGIKELRGYKRKTAEWLCSMAADERSSVIAKCKDGITITALYKSENPSYCQKNDEEKKKDLIKMERDIIEESVESKKPVDLFAFSEAVRVSHKDRSVYDAAYAISRSDTAVDEVRHYLRENGYVGVGSKTGKYFPAKKEYKNEIVKAIRQRFRSILCDIYSLRSIANRSEIGKLSCFDFCYEDDWHMAHGEKDIAYPLMIALWQLDLFDDIDVFENAYHIKWKRENLFYKGYDGCWYIKPGCGTKENENA